MTTPDIAGLCERLRGALTVARQMMVLQAGMLGFGDVEQSPFITDIDAALTGEDHEGDN
jgi:hypothetical protein